MDELLAGGQLAPTLNASAASATTTNSALSAGRSAFSELSTDQFFKIMFEELSNQDPLAPSDSKALLEQLSTLRSMQSDMDLSKDLRSMVARDEMTAAANLLGRRVSGLTERGQRVTSEVKAIYRTSMGATLGLSDGSRMAMSGLEQVVEPKASDVGASSESGSAS
jgi:flagellar basal-body rod modification protein FlgD